MDFIHFILDKDNKENYIPPDCTSIVLRYASKLEFLCTFLQSNNMVNTLDLSRCEIGDEGAKLIAETLKANCTIMILYLFWNQIGYEGSKAIAEALKVNRSISRLDLNWNLIGDEGAKAIAEVLKVNRTITKLYFRNGTSTIGDEGEKALAEALKVNCTVIHLGLYGKNRKRIAEELYINNLICEELKQVAMDAQCKTMTLGLFQNVPIYILLDIQECIITLDLERKTNSCKFYNNHSFLKLLENKVSKKRLVGIIDKMNRQMIQQSI